MGLYYNGKKVRNLYFNGKCITRLALGKEMTRLVEGDDFVRAEWLVGDGSAYISQQYNVWQNRLECEIYFNEYAGSNRRYVACTGSGYHCLIAATESENYYLMVIYRNDAEGLSHIQDIRTQNKYLIALYQDNSKSYANISGVIYEGRTIYENTWNMDKKFQIYSKKMSYIREVLPNNTYRSNLTPCRLLRPIPATLDANGIARNAGECGMYDIVSGKFYGNVANSGTFSVEGMIEGVDYEVHDILKTLAENTSSAPYDVAYFRFPNYISLIGKVLTLKLGNVYRDYNLEGDIVNNARYHILIYRAGLITTIQERLGNTVLNSVSNSSSTVEIDFDNNVVSVGTSTMNIQGTGYYTFGENNGSWGTEKYLKGLTISDVLNLIPVKLLKSIPSTYDANGIARQAGECGMYDTVNDKFYGNVANSGTFSVTDN